MRVQTCYLTQRALEQRTKGCGLHRVAKAIQSFLKRFDFLCCSQIIGRKKSFSSFFLIFHFFFSTNLSLADKNLLKIELLVMEELRIKEILQKKKKNGIPVPPLALTTGSWLVSPLSCPNDTSKHI